MATKSKQHFRSTREMPIWFGPALEAARHQDWLNSLPRWKRFLHRLLVGRKCLQCAAWSKQLGKS
jgi:hypothetical protein